MLKVRQNFPSLPLLVLLLLSVCPLFIIPQKGGWKLPSSDTLSSKIVTALADSKP